MTHWITNNILSIYLSGVSFILILYIIFLIKEKRVYGYIDIDSEDLIAIPIALGSWITIISAIVIIHIRERRDRLSKRNRTNNNL